MGFFDQPHTVRYDVSDESFAVVSFCNRLSDQFQQAARSYDLSIRGLLQDRSEDAGDGKESPPEDLSEENEQAISGFLVSLFDSVVSKIECYHYDPEDPDNQEKKETLGVSDVPSTFKHEVGHSILEWNAIPKSTVKK